MEIKNYIHIDFTRGKDIVVPSIQYDSGTRWVMAKLYNNGVPIDLQELKVCIVAVKPDGKEIFNECKIINAEKGIIEFEITKQMGILVGEVECQIKLFGPDQLLSSNIFKLAVTKTLSPSSESSKDELDVLVNALGEVQDIDNRFAQINAQLSEKLDKNGIVTMVNMGQDVKEAMSGGSVAVVDVDSILDENIVDNQINANKTSFLNQKHPNIFNANDNFNELDKTINSVGNVVEGVGFLTSNFIYALKNREYFFESVVFVSEYDLNKNFIKRSDYNADGFGSIILNANTVYVRLVVISRNIAKAFFSLTNEFIEYNDVHDIGFSSNKNGEKFKLFLDNHSFDMTQKYFDQYFFEERNIYTLVNSKNGIALNGNGIETDNGNYTTTDFIEVESHTDYYCDFFGYSTVALYDNDKNPIGGRLAWGAKSFNSGDATYLRATVITADKDKFHISKFSLDKVYSETFKEEIRAIVNKNTEYEEDKESRPLITFVDDDGYTLFLTKVKPIFDAHNIKCAIGVITNQVGKTGYLTVEELQALKSEGYIITSHSSSHSPALYKKDNYELLDNLDSIYEEDMNKSLNFLQKHGLDTDIFVYPNGWFSGSKYEKMMVRNTSKYYKFAVDNGTKYETTNNINRHMIKRIFIRDANGIDYYKKLIDEAKTNPNSLLVFGTHSGLSELSSEFLQSVIDYVVQSGITVLNPLDAFNEKM